MTDVEKFQEEERKQTAAVPKPSPSFAPADAVNKVARA